MPLHDGAVYKHANIGIPSNGFGADEDYIVLTYGAYIVDDTAWDVADLCTEFSPQGRVIDEFHDAWGFPFRTGADTPLGRDLIKIITRLHVVTNNTPGNTGGGPADDFINCRAPAAPAFGNKE